MKKILIVEDSRTQAERLRLLLARAGYEAEVAHTGEDGLSAAREWCPDLIISDVVMPTMSGFELCRTLKGSEETRRVPVILLTSRTSPADIIAGLEAGADNFIPKPYDDANLLERVRRIGEQLELRKRGDLDMEVLLTVGPRKIMVTADRQQIIELLFSTFEQISRNYDDLARVNAELRAATLEAERANVAKSAFLSRMSHELRTPLTSIIGFSQILEMSPLSPNDLECVKRIGKAGSHLLQLINELLDIGRIEADEMTVNLERVSLGDAFAEVAGLIEPMARIHDIRIVPPVGTHGVAVMADATRLRQVLLNLMSNAVKFNKAAGLVACSWDVVGDRVRMSISDTGCGIPSDHLARLFIPFDRIGAEKTDVEGVGLGLPVSKRLVELMAGELSVTSEVGVGTTFTLELPLAPVISVDDPVTHQDVNGGNR